LYSPSLWSDGGVARGVFRPRGRRDWTAGSDRQHNLVRVRRLVACAWSSLDRDPLCHHDHRNPVCLRAPEACRPCTLAYRKSHRAAGRRDGAREHAAKVVKFPAPGPVRDHAYIMNDFIIEQQGGVLRVTINHPERGNGMTDAMAAELTRLVDGAAKTASVMV